MIEISLLFGLVFLTCILFYFALVKINEKEKYGLMQYIKHDKQIINNDVNSIDKNGLININPDIDKDDDIRFDDDSKNKSMKYTYSRYVKNQRTKNTGNYSNKHINNS
jgi:hypothetical protein